VTKTNVSALTGNKIPFRIEGIALDCENPDVGTVAIAVPCPDGAFAESARRPLTGDAAAALAALEALAPDGGAVRLDVWRDACLEVWKKPTRGAAREAWRAVRNPEESRLLRDGLIAIEGEHVRLVRRQDASAIRQEPDGVSISVSSHLPLGRAATPDGSTAPAPVSRQKLRVKPASTQADLFGSGSV
jgi:hypothetical protein